MVEIPGERVKKQKGDKVMDKERKREMRKRFLSSVAEALDKSPSFAECRERTKELSERFEELTWKDRLGELPWLAISAFIELLADSEEVRIVL